jgi:hypothetical protein
MGQGGSQLGGIVGLVIVVVALNGLSYVFGWGWTFY